MDVTLYRIKVTQTVKLAFLGVTYEINTKQKL